MTGQELLMGLSFVDEKFIAEADQAYKRKTPWMKIFSVAACLCILFVGVYAMSQNKGAMEAAAPAAPAIMESAREEAAPAAPAPKEESTTAEPEAPAPIEEEMASGELLNVPYACLRVVKVLEDGSFEAVVEATQEMEADTRVIVVVDPSKVPGADREIHNDLSVITVDAVFEIYNGAYDPEENTLYVAQLNY